jgi:serine phosphatase RsbU (regulator of sigma subunit)
MDADLEVAKEIQTNALPSVFPPYPDRKEIELFASMKAAREVGGDFYDFYMLGKDNLAFLIADVSGKSIPGAMFMMKSKEVIKSNAQSGLPPAGIFTVANEVLCEGNDAEMFLTAWMGSLDLNTGEVNVANAGHNPPVLIRDGRAEFVVFKPGIMLGEFEEVIYKKQNMKLLPGDILFLYTDGVTEAMDIDENLYGEERLLKLLSFGENYPAPSGKNGIAGAICEMVATDIDRFVKDAEPSDDITMLCLRYAGKE